MFYKIKVNGLRYTPYDKEIYYQLRDRKNFLEKRIKAINDAEDQKHFDKMEAKRLKKVNRGLELLGKK